LTLYGRWCDLGNGRGELTPLNGPQSDLSQSNSKVFLFHEFYYHSNILGIYISVVKSSRWNVLNEGRGTDNDKLKDDINKETNSLRDSLLCVTDQLFDVFTLQ